MLAEHFAILQAGEGSVGTEIAMSLFHRLGRVLDVALNIPRYWGTPR